MRESVAVASGGLGTLDWVVIAAYFALLAGSGAFFAWRAKRRRSVESAEGYFLGAHAMPVWAVAISILATAQSAATFTGVPEQAYAGDISYLATNIGGVIGAVILAAVFIPAYYRLGVSTPYQLLERRFGPGAKLATSWAYMIGRVFASGSRVYIGAIPVSIAIFGDASSTHLIISILAFMAFGTVYTLAGGITSVIWTDVIQVCVYLGAAVLAVVLLASKIDAPLSEVVDALGSGGKEGASKLLLVPTGFEGGGFDWSREFSLPAILTGFVLLTLASHGTDQDLVQRMLTCKSKAAGSRSVIFGILVGVPAVALFLVLGLLLWIYYQRPELMGSVRPSSSPGPASEVLLRYILSEMPAGAAGLMIAGVMAAGPAGINSGLNSMSSTFVSDVYRPWKPGRHEKHYVRVGRLGVVAWGLVLSAFALLCIPWKAASGQSIIGFVLSVMSFAYAGLLGVFFTALFTRRGNTRSAIAALFAGFLVVLALRPEVAGAWTAWLEGVTQREVGSLAFKLAFPWQLTIGAAVAMAMCCAGARPKVLP
ncbi:MAG: sodium:solute symporter [Planctomycetota bacterium]|nr:sodium:solute symporter [Planctomycetota bacterium]